MITDFINTYCLFRKTEIGQIDLVYSSSDRTKILDVAESYFISEPDALLIIILLVGEWSAGATIANFKSKLIAAFRDYTDLKRFVFPNSYFFKVGDKIKFKNERNRYTVQACNSRYLICTKPFNAKKTVIYTIVDLEKGIKGTENLVFCAGFETQEDCQEALERLTKGETEISHRNNVKLEIERVDYA